MISTGIWWWLYGMINGIYLDLLKISYFPHCEIHYLGNIYRIYRICSAFLSFLKQIQVVYGCWTGIEWLQWGMIWDVMFNNHQTCFFGIMTRFLIVRAMVKTKPCWDGDKGPASKIGSLSSRRSSWSSWSPDGRIFWLKSPEASEAEAVSTVSGPSVTAGVTDLSIWSWSVWCSKIDNTLW